MMLMKHNTSSSICPSGAKSRLRPRRADFAGVTAGAVSRRGSSSSDSTTGATPAPSQVVVERVSSSKGSRKAASVALVRLLGLTTSPVEDVTAEQLAASPFPVYRPLFAQDVEVQQKRPYFFGRRYTDTDAARIVFYGAMVATAVALGPATYSPEAAGLALAGCAWLFVVFFVCCCHRPPSPINT
jgi:hypothetical protein